ncbi:MAG: RNA polymerase sigma factor [Armatimonadetes bacterium]|nr:RNA polymerase sigma factor [Armatimonadota bacterium]
MRSEDRTLVRECLKGRLPAFDRLYDRHGQRVYALLHRLTGNPTEAADLCQETFLTAYRTLSAWRGEGEFRTWLCGIAVRLARNSRRRATREPVAALSEEWDEGLVPDGTAQDPLTICTDRESAARMEAAVEALPPLAREAFVLVRLEGLSYREAAGCLEIPVGTLQSRLGRAVLLLRTALADLAPGSKTPVGTPQGGAEPPGPACRPVPAHGWSSPRIGRDDE